MVVMQLCVLAVVYYDAVVCEIPVISKAGS